MKYQNIKVIIARIWLPRICQVPTKTKFLLGAILERIQTTFNRGLHNGSGRAGKDDT